MCALKLLISTFFGSKKINELENGGNVIVKFIYNDCGFSFWSDQFLFIHLFNVH